MVRNQKIDCRKHQQEEGYYTCSQCGSILFEAKNKFYVGSGFPSFWEQIGENVEHNPLDTYGRHRIQLVCSQRKQHLGHLFDDNRTPTHVRFCINATSLKLDKEQE